MPKNYENNIKIRNISLLPIPINAKDFELDLHVMASLFMAMLPHRTHPTRKGKVSKQLPNSVQQFAFG